MKLDPEVVRENRNMAIGCLVCSLLMALGFVIAGRFDLSVLFGIAIGFVLSFGNFFFMSVGITKALASGDEARAKRTMRVSYLVRTVVQLGVLALSLLTDRIHWLPVAASLFYPRLIIAARNLFSRFAHRKDEDLPADAEDGDEEDGDLPDEAEEEDADPDAQEDPEPEPEEDAEPDEFEKFVGFFSRGPVPGEDKKEPGDGNTDNKRAAKAPPARRGS